MSDLLLWYPVKRRVREIRSSCLRGVPTRSVRFIGISGYQYFNERLSPWAGGFTLTRSASAGGLRTAQVVTRGSYRSNHLATLQYLFFKIRKRPASRLPFMNLSLLKL